MLAEGVGVLLFESDGYPGAPGAAGIAGVFGTWSVGPDRFRGEGGRWITYGLGYCLGARRKCRLLLL